MSRAGPRRSGRAVPGANYADPPSDEDDEEMLESEEDAEAELDEEDEVSDENEGIRASKRPRRVDSEELTVRMQNP